MNLSFSSPVKGALVETNPLCVATATKLIRVKVFTAATLVDRARAT